MQPRKIYVIVGVINQSETIYIYAICLASAEYIHPHDLMITKHTSLCASTLMYTFLQLIPSENETILADGVGCFERRFNCRLHARAKSTTTNELNWHSRISVTAFYKWVIHATSQSLHQCGVQWPITCVYVCVEGIFHLPPLLAQIIQINYTHEYSALVMRFSRDLPSYMLFNRARTVPHAALRVMTHIFICYGCWGITSGEVTARELKNPSRISWGCVGQFLWKWIIAYSLTR